MTITELLSIHNKSHKLRMGVKIQSLAQLLSCKNDMENALKHYRNTLHSKDPSIKSHAIKKVRETSYAYYKLADDIKRAGLLDDKPLMVNFEVRRPSSLPY